MEKNDRKRTATKQLASWAYMSARATALTMTRWMAYRFGKDLGYVYVGGYPKSGTTWVSQQVASYLDIPLVDPTPPLPQVFKSLIHNHWSYHPSLDHSFYVIRDGRDVMVSSYMSSMRGVETAKADIESFAPWSPVRNLVFHTGEYAHILRRVERLFGRKFEIWDIRNNLPKFIEAEMTDPIRWAVHQPWPAHVRTWREMAKETVFIRYEDLLKDNVSALTSALQAYLKIDVDHDEIFRIVEHYSFKHRTGRKPGTEDRGSFVRKGISGDWKNYFSSEARQVFDHYAGDMLIELGYATDRGWVNQQDDKNPQALSVNTASG
jgi:hypothetical protein